MQERWHPSICFFTPGGYLVKGRVLGVYSLVNCDHVSSLNKCFTEEGSTTPGTLAAPSSTSNSPSPPPHYYTLKITTQGCYRKTPQFQSKPLDLHYLRPQRLNQVDSVEDHVGRGMADYAPREQPLEPSCCLHVVHVHPLQPVGRDWDRAPRHLSRA
jgi:hypothetical protein